MIDLLIEYGGDINTRDDRGATPLMKIIKENDVKYYDFIISRGAEINLRCKTYGKTVLHYLAEDKNFDVALHLIEKHEANPYLRDIQNCNNNIFMMFAIELNSHHRYEENICELRYDEKG